MSNCKVLLLAIGLLFATASPSLAQGSFTANFEVRRPNTNGAVVRGAISYHVEGRRYRLDYIDRQFHEVFNFGLPTSTPPDAGITPWHYEIGTHCAFGCLATRIDHAFPVYVNDPSIYQASAGPAADGCGHYSPIDPASTPITDIWFHPTTGRICSAWWSDGAEYTFSSISPANLSSSGAFYEPEDCVGADRTDLVILLDRSASISSGQYDAARQLIRDFVRDVTISLSQARVAIAHFDVGAQLVLDVFEGTSLANVDAAVSSMTCSCADTLDKKLKPAEVRPGTATCCARRTSISAALDWTSLFLTTSGRGDPAPTRLTRKVVVVISDGNTNTLRDGVTPCSGKKCRADLEAAINDLRQAHHSLELYVASANPNDGAGLAFEVIPPIANFVPGPLDCSAGSTCDPTTCGGKCECSECTAPTACDPSLDFCQVNQIVPGGRRCELLPRDCEVAPGFTRCDNGYCDVKTQACEKRPVVCTESPNPACFQRRCVQNTGQCTTDVFSNPLCEDECDADSECNDNNVCTVDTCATSDSLRFCRFTPRTCDDGDPCTVDFCTDHVVGCQSRPRPSTFCDDGVSCTVDECIAGVGCRSTAGSCDDGQTCTQDTCDLDLGHCVHSVCPAGTTPLFGACWKLGGWNVFAGVPLDCNQVCAGVGLTYDDATRTVAGSDGTDANCEAVLTALGAVFEPGFDAPSATCSAGLGCFSDVLLDGSFPGEGRCAIPATAATATKPWVRRACACM